MARIEDYALIGDCESAALVSREGSIDWLCWPRFDSDACFAALLGKPENGCWRLHPVDEVRERRRTYREDTMILETWVRTDHGAVRILDFMPPHESNSDIVRLVIGEEGVVRMHTDLTLRFDYGETVPWVTRTGEDEWTAIAGPHMTVLHTTAPMHGENMHSVAEFDVRAGETVPFTLTYAASHLPPPARIDVNEALSATETYWRGWASRCEYRGPHRDIVMRSLLTLRALIYTPTGGIVAAPTTSLPEQLGGTRNWDYRFCWLRDATLTLLALMNSGYSTEAAAWRDWLVRAVAGSPGQMQIMYGVAGERRLTELELPWLEGYEGSKPVRIGNGAHEQLQLDVYGEVMDALHQSRQGGLHCDLAAWAVQRKLLEHVEAIWREPDSGMWEIRSAPRHFTFSKIMAWVAFDRALKSAERFHLPGELDHWRALRDEIRRDVLTHGFDATRNTFTQSYGSKTLDASLLLIPSLGFLPAGDPRVQGTIAAIERELLRDGFVLRYDTEKSDDGLPAGEGAFLACSFWLADAYTMCGRMQEAKALFERLVGLCSDLGLLAEEYDIHARRQVGNFPQAFSHVALLNTAYNLARSQKPAEQRSERAVPA